MKLSKYFKLLMTCIVLCLALCGCGLFKTKIDLTQYISYSYEGISGYTTMTANLDKEKIKADFAEEISEKKQAAFDELIAGMDIKISKSENLVNGDMVMISAVFDEEHCKSAGVKFAGNDIEITIEGLREGELLDLFADIDVSVTGIAPFTTATIENKSANTFLQNLSYSLDVTEGFRAGDILTVSCEVSDDQAGEAGYVVLERSEKFATDEIPYYVEKPEQLDNNMLSTVVEEAKATVSTETEDNVTRMLYELTGSSNFLFQYNKEWVETIALQEAKLLTCVDKTHHTVNGAPYNKIWLIFKAYVTNADHGSDGYFCFEYSNIVIRSDGTMDVKHDNQNLRYICDADYNKLLERIMTGNDAYVGQDIDVNLLQAPAASSEDESMENTENAQNVVQ